MKNVKGQLTQRDINLIEYCLSHLPINSDIAATLFYPNKYITLDEVLSAFLKVLGEKGFTSEEVMNLSEKHNLLKNVDIEETEITRGNFTQLAYNFMEEYSILFSEKL